MNQKNFFYQRNFNFFEPKFFFKRNFNFFESKKNFMFFIEILTF